METSDITSSSLKLTWKPSLDDGGVEISAYFIEKQEKTQKQWQKVAEVGPDVMSYMVQNLLEGHEYFFRVFAVNAIGVSDALEASEQLKSPFGECSMVSYYSFIILCLPDEELNMFKGSAGMEKAE